MTDREALLHAIADRPSDPLRQLVFADYLQENGHESRAAFVRLRCEAERVGRDSPQYDDLLREGDDLLREHEREWVDVWADRLVDWEYDGGFIRSVRMTASQFERHGAELFAWEPVERFTFINDDGYLPTDGEVEQLVMHPAFEWVRRIRLQQHRFQHHLGGNGLCVDGWFRGLSKASHVQRLRELSLNDCGQALNRLEPKRDSLNRELLHSFCQAEHLHTLERLVCNHLAHHATRDADRAWLVEELAESTFLPNLRHLSLRDCALGDTGLLRIADDRRFSGLEQLDLLWSRQGLYAWERLLRSPHLDSLGDIAVTSSALPVLAERCQRHPLMGLTVAWGEEPQEWVGLIESCPPLKRLCLWVCNPGAPAFDTMKHSGWLQEVEELELRGDSQGDVYGEDHAGVDRLFVSPTTLPKLRRLTLHELADQTTVEALANWPHLNRLERLALTCDNGGRLYVDQFHPRLPLTRLRELSGVQFGSATEARRLRELLQTARVDSLGATLSGSRQWGAYDRREFSLWDDELRELLRSEPFARLTKFELGFHSVESFIPDALPVLSDPTVLRRVRLFDPAGIWEIPPDERVKLVARYGHRILLLR